MEFCHIAAVGIGIITIPSSTAFHMLYVYGRGTVTIVFLYF